MPHIVTQETCVPPLDYDDEANCPSWWGAVLDVEKDNSQILAVEVGHGSQTTTETPRPKIPVSMITFFCDT